MKQQTSHESVAASLPLLQQVKRQLILRYRGPVSRGTENISSQYSDVFALGVEAYASTQGYRRLQDAIPGIVQVWDRGGIDAVTKKQKPDRFIAAIRVEHYEFVFLIENLSLFTQFASDYLLVVPIIPELLRSLHAINC